MKKIIILLSLALSFILVGCSLMAQDIEEVKNESYIGEKIIVSGVVKESVKIGDLSGYILEDETGTIAVSSSDLPKEGEEVTVRGTLRKNIVMYYIETD
mgnify:CR=1 FL=1